jgi:FtsZ-binding cell division protein ZapB
MSDDEVDVGMTMAMDMIEKLNEEHSETIEKNIKLEKEIQEIKDKRDGITEEKCDFCDKTKRSTYKEYWLRTSNGIKIDDKLSGDHLVSNHKLKCCEECRKIHNGGKELTYHWNDPEEIEAENSLRTDMIDWEEKWKKIKSPFTYKLVKEWDRIMDKKNDMDLLDESKGVGGLLWPCCFRGDRYDMRDYVYYECVLA